MSNECESGPAIRHVKNGDYHFSSITLPPDAGGIGFRRCTRREFLQEHRSVTFNQPVLSGEQIRHHALFNQEAAERLENRIQAMEAAQGITEELMGRNQMAQVGAMNHPAEYSHFRLINCIITKPLAAPPAARFHVQRFVIIRSPCPSPPAEPRSPPVQK